ncbi:hypothetical protein LCGC14_1953590 [marine sediment metagenome]|uniref:Uncharacterized protein n=1 Tax=marine sediment metagenome TaxID=412755 RepID=A0A0F9IDS2_9ZZZZ
MKTKQEEIRDTIKEYLRLAHTEGSQCEKWKLETDTDSLMKCLAALGVVIKVERGHDSDCATHNEPAYPNGECDCVVLPVGCVAVEELI